MRAASRWAILPSVPGALLTGKPPLCAALAAVVTAVDLAAMVAASARLAGSVMSAARTEHSVFGECCPLAGALRLSHADLHHVTLQSLDAQSIQ